MNEEDTKILQLRCVKNILSAAEIGCMKYGVTLRTLFEGLWISKKMGDEYFYRRRFIWIDPRNEQLHWSKSSNRGAPHKRVCLRDVSRVLLGLPSRGDFKPYDTANCCSIEINNQIIDFKVDDPYIIFQFDRILSSHLPRIVQFHEYPVNTLINRYQDVVDAE